ncbi:hypothetical protein G6F21_014560 [Rhizopus arrhizus]|nr:hypothetical protein G6F21_014560 [Rhizopus arrhizus]
MVPTRSGDLQCTPRMRLPAHVGQIRQRQWRGVHALHGRQQARIAQPGAALQQRARHPHIGVLGQRSLGGIARRYHQNAPGFSGRNRRGQRTGHRP